VVMGTSYSPKIVTDDLVLCFDAANTRSYPRTGTTWTDISAGFSDSLVSRSTADNGTLTNGPTFDTTNKGSIVFDGTNDHVIISTAPTSLVTDSSPVTISVWAYPHIAGQGMIFGNGNSDRFYVETWGSGPSVFHWGFGGSNNSTTSQATFSINNWYNYVASYDGTNVRGYLNSILTDTTSLSNPSYGGSELKIGNWQNNLYFNGNISNVSVYNRALSEEEIKQNYKALRGRYL